MSKNVVPMKPDDVKPQFMELYTDGEVAEYGEVLSTTPSGAVFVKKGDNINLFTPCAKCHSNSDEFYYQRVDFK